nr:thyroid adenoma-associated protein homolog [Helicoverpa armigera]
MNGLALRINRGGGGKSKTSIGYSPIAIPASLFENTENGHKEIYEFISSVCTDDQLVILKNIIDRIKQPVDDVIMKFLVAAFFHAEAKHPIKCVVSRHIIKNKQLQDKFSDALAEQITSHITAKASNYKQYADVVGKLITSIENFPAGVQAMKMVELALARYLTDCLSCCVKTLREQKTLSPTEKNEIFTLAHMTIRLLLHITQKISTESKSNLILMFEEMRLLIQDLMFDDDVPMDTKSVGGILYLTVHVTEYGTDSWVEVLNSSTTNTGLSKLLTLEAGRLSLYSAIVTVVPADHLYTHMGDDEPAILAVTKKILDIGERSSSEAAYILAVARTALQLGKLVSGPAGLALSAALLGFAWGSLEHHMDSVRHLAGQLLACLVRYCAHADATGDSRALDTLTSALSSVERSRKSYYICVSHVAAELPARTVRALVRPSDLLPALREQPLHNTARAALEALLDKCLPTCSLDQLHAEWLQPLLQCAKDAADDLQLGALQQVLARAVRVRTDVREYLLQYIKEASTVPEHRDLKCVLMLLRVVRNSAGGDTLPQTETHWKGIIAYHVLEEAAIDAVDETRILSLSLIVESPKSTEVFSEGDLRLVLHYLEHNINAQAPNFRQLTLSAMKKFIKRFEESYAVLHRELQSRPNADGNKVAYYLRFAEELRRLCFASLLPGANYSRRFVALQLLAWCEQMCLEGYQRSWEPEYVDKLLRHLEDSYENNKAFALEVLASCPVELLKRKSYSISLELEDIISQASLLKPTECVSAAYKLDLLRTKLPEYILQDEQCDTSHIPERVSYSLCSRLLRAAHAQLLVLRGSVVAGAARAPLYGVLHCLAHTLGQVDAKAISCDVHWLALVGDTFATCMSVSEAVACVVNNSSPEGHLPMDMTVQVTDHGNSGNVTLDDGRQVTAQMVLLCAWRSVKEVSLLLGGMCGRLTVSGEDGPTGTLSEDQLVGAGEHFTRLLAETKHRGAFEQAYVGFTMLLDRLWRCRSASLHGLPRRWLRELLRAVADDEDNKLCATRRSAGLPFMIQALVSTEVQVQGNPLCFHECMTTLLSLCTCGTPRARGHALHVVRALVRHSALAQRVAPYVAPAMLAALKAFDANTWAERNSATLLLSALVSRVFGVSRAAMTGRIFFLRYPQLYDFMLDALVRGGSEAHTLRPALYAVLLLLARLYPSSLEGTETNLKLVSFVPHVQACARSRVLHTRRLAARALVPLIPHQLFSNHFNSMLEQLESCDSNTAHGIALQLIELARRRGPELAACGLPARGLLMRLRAPCYVLAADLVWLVSLIDYTLHPHALKSLPQETVEEIISCLHTLIFPPSPAPAGPGRDLCFSRALSLYLILATKYNVTDIPCLVYQGLQHTSYEVVLAVLDYLLILHKDSEVDTTNFHENLTEVADTSSILKTIKSEKYIQLLCNVLKNNYLECQEKSLKILMLEGDTQRYIIEAKTDVLSDEKIIDKLIDRIENEHEKLTHIYLQSLLDFVKVQLMQSKLRGAVLLQVVRVLLECSSAKNCVNTRTVVAKFIETNFSVLLEVDVSELADEDKFELRATIWATTITLLEDDEPHIRRRVTRVAGAACAVRERLRSTAGSVEKAVALLALVALLDFQSVVVVADDVTDECRVFDQNERYNIFLEESVWTVACADILANEYKLNDTEVSAIIDKPTYKQTFDKLCNDNVDGFRKMAAGEKLPRNDTLNPKIELFVNRLRKLSN